MEYESGNSMNVLQGNSNLGWNMQEKEDLPQGHKVHDFDDAHNTSTKASQHNMSIPLPSRNDILSGPECSNRY
jgi:hypothetical protein